MPRRRAVQFIFCLLGLMVAASSFVGSVAAASTGVVVTGGFTTTEAGVFTVGIAAKPAAGGCAAATDNPAFGPFAVDAVGVANGVTPTALDLCVAYTDTETSRGAFTVQIKIDSFELKADQVPTFEGADQAHFQIPNRYLVLNTVGAITATGTPPADPGTLKSATSGQGSTFDSGPVTIATAGGTKGSGTAIQELDLTLNIPAGVYPGEYDTTITVETVTGP